LSVITTGRRATATLAGDRLKLLVEAVVHKPYRKAENRAVVVGRASPGLSIRSARAGIISPAGKPPELGKCKAYQSPRGVILKIVPVPLAPPSSVCPVEFPSVVDYPVMATRSRVEKVQCGQRAARRDLKTVPQRTVTG